MNYFKYILALGLIISLGSLSAQNLTEAFVNQDYDKIKSNLSKTVSIKVNNSKKVIGPSQGMQLIENVLSEFQPVRMENKHKGSSQNADSDYLITRLYNANGESLRVFIHLENYGEGKQICDVKIRRS